MRAVSKRVPCRLLNPRRRPSVGSKHADDANHAADSHDLIRVQGARENNLKDVSVEIPKRRLTVFTGVSGSGKSSSSCSAPSPPNRSA